MNKFFLAVIALFCISVCYGQTEEYRGTLLMEVVDIPVEGIEVKAKGGVKASTATNYEGVFYIRNVKYPFKVTFSHRNYIKSAYTVNSAADSTFHIAQNPKFKATGDTGASRDMKLGENETLQSIVERLRATPGVTISGSTVLIRGASSVNLSSAPLIEIDGSRFYGTIFDVSINPNDIKSIRVLKGPDASAYGMAGAGGVIVIKTKSGGD